ncbi:DUF4394 domain-containing protein [Iningainema sp. BLCCT55]|uniref:DUF4394 domain-containing protein n=2 Tax=Iningainema TaxID=1932705 RepID=A0A8J7C6R6_9CYAN|nr:DUF4394 domain-containing protein [Iningainema tapete BLCC-T55]
MKTIAQTSDLSTEGDSTAIEPATDNRLANLRLIALTTNNTLVNINLQGGANTRVRVRGINGNLVGIDFRPANNLLYGLTDTDNLYTINPDNGQATLVRQLSNSFNGGFQSGFDFNPAADRLRVVGSNGQNFRINVDTGEVITDGPIAFAADDVSGRVGFEANITASAYTNNVAGATSTQLYNIDYDQDILVLQNPPNAGTLRTVGSLGVNFAPIGGFDIFTDAQGNNTAYALSGTTLYTINLSTGAATRIANVPGGNFISLAITAR